MKRIFSIIENLQQLSGNSQLNYLNSVKNDLLKDILLYTYDTHKKYKIDEGKYNKVNTTINTKLNFSEHDWNDFKVLLDSLSEKKSATDDDVLSIKIFIDKYEESDFLKMILFKDLRINMGIKKFQKIWSDFCVEPQVQLAESKPDKTFINGKYSRKFDGKRMYILNGVPYSRSNNECYNKPVQHILEQVQELLGENKNYFVLDGECLYFENGKENFQKGISLCQSEERKEGCDNICYVIFDIIPKENFVTKQAWISFEKEYDRMINEFADFSKQSPDYSLIPTKVPNVFIARQDEYPSKLMKLRTENNWEGLMYRNADASYEYKRTNNLLKIKAMQDTELKLLDMEIGTGKNAGKLGAFIVEYKNSKVKVGSGFSDELREEYWNNKDKYIGKSVKVQYFEETTNQDGTPSLRFPVFLSFRNIDTNEEYL